MLKAATIRLALAAALALPLAGASHAPSAQAQTRCGDTWRVSPGDTLSSISRACGIPSAAIEAANPSIDWRRLQVGARVNLDTRGARPPAGNSGRPQAYVVQRGDTLSSIARSFGVSLQALLAANPGLSERDLQVGRTIYFSGFAGRPNTAPPPPVRPAPTRVDVRIDDRDSYPGGGINLLVEGLRPGDAVSAEAGPTNGRGGTEAETRVDRRGFANLALDISPRARPGERWSYEIYDGRGRVVADGTFRVGEEPRQPGRPGGPGRPGNPERVSITGVISNEGVECPVIRAENGRLYSLAGGLSGFRPGDRVTVLGEIAQMSTCMQGTTIAVNSIRPAR
ncbi:LysM peptidoglycan-binding domain-containing protein [Aureimonas mangrovi]|uniref:LysM peptidoglycan-binding domain-containing protein n=1 Tax=Aureimonas mangrovi TaxID=2758041 RepID=UPI00163D83C5|nr:LysM peptidoglycan-binding domain-containing protein [Aureimonas mangrovi]